MAKKLFFLYILLVSIFTILLIAVFAIPTSAIKNNIVESAKQIQKEGLWFQPLGFYLFQIDNMTDCLMMNINASADSDNPIRSSMIINFYQPYENGDIRTSRKMDRTTIDVIENEKHTPIGFGIYARYWHGYQVILRPLLNFFNYNQIRVINYIALFVLFTITIILLYKRLNILYALSFAATLIISNIMIVPLAIQFSTCFYIALFGMIIVLNCKRITDSKRLTMMFFTIGAFTSYMDFLTTPILTLGFPLLVLVAINKEKEKLRTLFTQSFVWFAGYASIWASKWLIGWILTGENIIDSAMTCAQQRVGNTIVFGGAEMYMNQFFDIILTKLSNMIYPICIAIGIVIILMILYFYKNRDKVKKLNWLVIIALMPIVWFIVMKNHSLQHIFFTWRDYMLTLWCMLIFAFSNYKKIKAQ